MPTRELPEIARPTREEYVTLLQDIALTAGVSSENIAELLKAKRWTARPTLTLGKPTQIRFAIEHEFPITLESRAPGRVFELAGQSDRNKTTSLIYLATLLGIHWEESRPFLDRDDKVYNVATRFVRPALSHGRRAELHLTSEGYDLGITVAEGRAMLSLLDEQRVPLPDFNSKVIPLSSLEDWQPYREALEPLCDVQFVGKSRDFIGQVTVEESKDLILLCRDVSERGARLRRDLQDLPREQVYGRTEQELAEEAANIQARLEEVKREITGLKQKIADFQQLAQDGRELVAVWQVLEDDRDPSIQELLKCLKIEEMVQDHDRRKSDLEKMIPTIEQELARANQQLQQQEPLLTRIQESLEALKGRISSELKELSTFGARASQLLRCIAQKDYEPIFAFCDYAQVGPETIQLLEALLAVTKEFSKGLVIPIDSSDRLGLKLSDLERNWTTARAIAIDIQRLNPELTQAYQALQAVDHSSVQALRSLESLVTTTRALVVDRRRRLRALQSELQVTNETIQSLLGAKEMDELKAQSHALRQALSQDHRDQLDRVEELSRAVGYNRPWQLNPSDLQAVIRDSEAKVQSFEEEKTIKEKAELQLRDMLQDIQRSERRTSIGRPQLDALREFQDILGFIIDYLDQFRRQREKSPTYEEHHFEQLKARLGDHLEKVRSTLNLVLRRRCPHMYKNRAAGLEKLQVQDYDFLTGLQSVPELQKGEWAGGGGDSAMTVFGLASRSTGSLLGTVLLVDEFNDAETFKTVVCQDIAALDQVAFAIFVKQDPRLPVPGLEVMK
jgi:hypothetical protein